MLNGDTARAIEMLEESLSQDPFQAESNAAMAVLQLEAGHRDAAERCFEILQQQNAPQVASIRSLLYPGT